VAADQLIASNPEPTLERFTERARRVLAAAVRGATPAPAGSAHLLLAQFAQKEGLAARALEALDITEAAVRAATQAARSPAGADSPAGAPPPAAPLTASSPAASSPTASAQQSDQPSQPRFTEEGKHLLRDAVAVALELGHNYIGTEHLLLASYRHRDSDAAKVLRALCATETATTDLLTGMLAEPRQTR
jgi:ATP-dependent Clp protease ATP-binding subunit ClpA